MNQYCCLLSDHLVHFKNMIILRKSYLILNLYLNKFEYFYAFHFHKELNLFTEYFAIIYLLILLTFVNKFHNPTSIESFHTIYQMQI